VSFLSVFDPIPAPFDQPPSKLGSVHMVTYILTWLSACINPIIYCLTNRYYREAHLELVRKLVCPNPRPSSNVANAFTESTNLSIPLKKKLSNLSKPERSDQSDLSEPSDNPNIIVVKDSLQEKSAKVLDPLKEGEFSTHTDLAQSKTTLELKEWDWDSKQQMRGGVEECKQPIHLSASLQGRMRKLEDVE